MAFKDSPGVNHQRDEPVSAFTFGEVIKYLFSGYIMRRSCFHFPHTVFPEHHMTIAYSWKKNKLFATKSFVKVLNQYVCFFCCDMATTVIAHEGLIRMYSKVN